MGEDAEPRTGAHERRARSTDGWRNEVLFLATYGAMVAGLAVAVLDATGITTRAGAEAGTGGAIYTSIYMAIVLLALALAVPYAPKLAARVGMKRTFVWTNIAASILWGVAGLLIFCGAPSVPVLLMSAVGFGATAGSFAVLNPLYSRAYIEGRGMAGAYARLSVAGGVAWALGSVGGGAILNQLKPGWGLLIRAALGIPLAVFVALRRPVAEPTPIASEKRGAWSEMFGRLRDNRDLRLAALLGCGVAVFAAPLVSLIVPITDALRQDPLIPGAGMIMAGMAVGEVLAPAIVSRLEQDRTRLHAAALAASGAAFFIAVYATAALALSRRPELIVWVIVGIGFGAMRYGGRALNLGAATDAGNEEDSSEMVATFVFASSIAAPVGVLAWGLLINQASVEAALFAGAAGTLLVASRFLRQRAPS